MSLGLELLKKLLRKINMEIGYHQLSGKFEDHKNCMGVGLDQFNEYNTIQQEDWHCSGLINPPHKTIVQVSGSWGYIREIDLDEEPNPIEFKKFLDEFYEINGNIMSGIPILGNIYSEMEMTYDLLVKHYDKNYTMLSGGIYEYNNGIIYIHNSELSGEYDTIYSSDYSNFFPEDYCGVPDCSNCTREVCVHSPSKDNDPSGLHAKLNDDDWHKVEVKLHLGCGSKHIPGYVNIDCRYQPGVDEINNVEFLRNYEENSVDVIYACHVLEHLGRHNYMRALERWYKILKPGGIIRIAVPNFDAIVRHYRATSNLNSLIGLLYGGQDYDKNIHTYIWDFKTLSEDLRTVGFNNIQQYHWQYTEHSHIDDYSQCYIPHMDKENGTLMSLNIQATK